MGRVRLILVMIIFIFNTARSQQEANVADIEKVTYELYLAGSWKELIRTGEKAIKQGIDYYYLRMRLGIAAYETEDYSKAARHFGRAMEFNSADDTAKEYLYFAYTFHGRDMEAHKVARGFSSSLKDKLSYDRSAVRSFSINATGSFLQNRDIIDNYSSDAVPAIDGFQSLTRNFLHFGASLEHDAGKLIKFTHSPGYLSKSYLYYSQSATETVLVTDATLSQFQYYLSGRILFGNGAYLTPAVHYLNVRIPYETTMTGRGGRPVLVQQYFVSHDIATSIGIEKYFGKVRPGLTAGYSYINMQPQVQGTFSLSLFPFGNLNLYGISDITRYSLLTGNDNGGRWIFSQNIGFRAFPDLWVELEGSWGQRENFAGSSAFLVYNDPVVTKERYGAALIAPLYDRDMELYLHYTFTLGESSFIPENYESGMPINPIKLNNHKISGGVKWKF